MFRTSSPSYLRIITQSIKQIVEIGLLAALLKLPPELQHVFSTAPETQPVHNVCPTAKHLRNPLWSQGLKNLTKSKAIPSIGGKGRPFICALVIPKTATPLVEEVRARINPQATT